jgi:hypothetical protein
MQEASMTLRLITLNGSMVKPTLVISSEVNKPPVNVQEVLNRYCTACFLHRRHYLLSISADEPFDLIRAQQIVEIMISKGTTDPKAYSLGTLLKENIGYLKSLSKE